MPNILYISYDGMTDPLGQSQVLPYLVGLSEKGYRITLLSCEKQERWQYKEQIQAICSKYHINWQPLMYTKKPPVFSTIKDVRQLKKLALQLHKSNPFDVVHCRSYVAALVGVYLKRKFDLGFVFDMRGFWADERVDGGLWNLKKPIYKKVYQYFKRKEKQFLAEADAVVSLTYEAKREIETWAVPHAPITVIPCCVDTITFNPEGLNAEQTAALRRKADVPQNKIILGYVGSLGTWYLLDEMMSFFAVWLKKLPDSILFFVTTEPKEHIYQSAAKNRIPRENLRIIQATRNEMPHYLSLMDFGLFFIKNAYSKKASSPVKQGELMAMGIPVICNAGVGDSDLIIHQYQSGELVYSFDEAAYEDVILRLQNGVNHPDEIRKGAFDYFDLQKGIDAYEAVYQSIGAAIKQ